ncbi:hypothetical protein UA08_06714 [Talaromyces atroroseus]|uniref:Zn(2)-C6 fungal-type domain-containing protein n=1 Tax=Talaromyces atroroseus TaxID=1441469 RepID=A0A225ATZ7_TALAT|nr:hypothetical protein UA08_06714 [Talaromyces atroroseus]OKL57885.1 hypothetical protein UA08_06714 [Talaromyces atroroseus]
MSDSSASSSRKRQRLRPAKSYPRKRTAVACELCRARKTRCDNGRPSCSVCVESGVVCSYTVGSNGTTLTPEPSPSQLLARIDYAVQLLEQQGQSHTPEVQTNEADVEEPCSHEVLRPEGGTRSELMLDWPCLRGYVPAKTRSLLWLAQPDSTLDDIRGYSHDPSVRNGGATFSSGAEESYAVQLVKRYLTLVHIKNPILDEQTLLKQARGIAEVGFDWTGESCLVLLACALATLVTAYDDRNENGSFPSNRTISKSYFRAARKRLGLLDLSLVAAQCRYLTAIYEMCSFRVMEAWSHYQQASTITGTLLLRQIAMQAHDLKLLERLYYSCIRSHGDIDGEVPLPQCELVKFKSLGLFPSLPDMVLSPSPEIDSEISETANVGWFYYLAEISALRTSMQMRRALYSHGEDWWITDIQYVIKQVNSLEEEIDAWYDHLPDTIKWHAGAKVASAELASILYARLRLIKLRLLHPCLYFNIHASSDNPMWTEASRQSLKALDLSAQTLDRHSSTNAWRHGGTWFMVRSTFKACLSILAAIRSGRFVCDKNWVSLIRRGMSVLEVWREECGDVLWMELIVKQLLEDTLANPPTCASGQSSIVWSYREQDEISGAA